MERHRLQEENSEVSLYPEWGWKYPKLGKIGKDKATGLELKGRLLNADDNGLLDADLPHLGQVRLAEEHLPNAVLHQGRHPVIDGLLP